MSKSGKPDLSETPIFRVKVETGVFFTRKDIIMHNLKFINIKRDVIENPELTSEETATYMALVATAINGKAYVTRNNLEMIMTGEIIPNINLNGQILSLATKLDTSSKPYIKILSNDKNSYIIDMSAAEVDTSKDYFAGIQLCEIQKIFQNCKNNKYNVLRVLFEIVASFSHSTIMGKAKDRVGFCSLESISEKTNLGVATISRCINILVDLQLIHRFTYSPRRRSDGSLKQDCNSYSRWEDRGYNISYCKKRIAGIQEKLKDDPMYEDKLDLWNDR